MDSGTLLANLPQLEAAAERLYLSQARVDVLS